MAMVEPFVCHRVDGRVRNDLSPEAMIRAVTRRLRARRHLRLHLAEGAGRGRHGAGHRRLDAARAAARRRGARRPAGARSPAGARRCTLPNVKGIVAGRSLLYPPGRRRRRRRGHRREPAVNGAPTSSWRTSCTARPEAWPTTAMPCPSPPSRPAGATPACACLTCRPAAATSSAPATTRCSCCRWPDRAWSSATGSTVPAGRPGRRVQRRHRLRLRAAAAPWPGCSPPRAAGSRCPAPGPRRRLPPRYGPPPVSPSSCAAPAPARRQVNNFCTPGRFEADRLIACEVITPAGNWSSYPPHKHDEDRPGESRARGDLLLRDRADGPAGAGRRLPARLRHRGPADRRAGRGPHRRRGADPARLARPVDGRRPATTCTTST